MWETIKAIIQCICAFVMCGAGGTVLWAGAYGLKHKGHMPKWESIGMICWGALVLAMGIGSFIDYFCF